MLTAISRCGASVLPNLQPNGNAQARRIAGSDRRAATDAACKVGRAPADTAART